MFTACGIMNRRCCLLVCRSISSCTPVPSHPGHQQAASSVHYTTSCKHILVLLRMGETMRWNWYAGACSCIPVPPHPGHQQAASSVHYTTSCKHSLVLLRMGETMRWNWYAGAYVPAHQFHLILVTSRQHRRCIVPQAVNTV